MMASTLLGDTAHFPFGIRERSQGSDKTEPAGGVPDSSRPPTCHGTRLLGVAMSMQ